MDNWVVLIKGGDQERLLRGCDVTMQVKEMNKSQKNEKWEVGWAFQGEKQPQEEPGAPGHSGGMGSMKGKWLHEAREPGWGQVSRLPPTPRRRLDSQCNRKPWQGR